MTTTSFGPLSTASLILKISHSILYLFPTIVRQRSTECYTAALAHRSHETRDSWLGFARRCREYAEVPQSLLQEKVHIALIVSLSLSSHNSLPQPCRQDGTLLRSFNIIAMPCLSFNCVSTIPPWSRRRRPSKRTSSSKRSSG